jgi:hypothetical protein
VGEVLRLYSWNNCVVAIFVGLAPTYEHPSGNEVVSIETRQMKETSDGINSRWIN